MPRRTARGLKVGALIALLLLILGSGLSYRSVHQFVEAAEWRSHTLEVLNRLEELRALMNDAARGRRSYGLTKDPRMLAPCRIAIVQVGPRLRDLEAWTADNPDQLQRLARLRPLVDRQLARFGQVLTAKFPPSPRQEAREAPLADKDHQGFVDELEAMARSERELLATRTSEAEARARFTTALTLTVNALSVTLLALVGALLFRQMGARERAEASLQQAHDDLARRVEERTAELSEKASMLDLVRDAILVTDMTGRIRYWGPGAERLYGWTAPEAVGQIAPQLLYRGERALIEAALREVVETGEWKGELHEVNRQGQPLIVESHWGLIRGPDGSARGVIGSNADVTEKRKQEQRALLAQRLESIGTLAGGIAHDLNNVLTPILMTVKLLRKGRPGVDAQRLLETAELSVERGAEMVKQLLSFAGRAQGQRGPVSVGPVVREVTSLLGHVLPKSIQLRTALAPDLWAVEGDPTQLSQVLMNLAINARDAMPEGGTLTLECANREIVDTALFTSPDARPGRFVLLSVIDTGTGITPEVMARIFDPFFTTKEVGKGTGLGLSTALGIVRAHKGFLQLYSEVGHGTRISVYLPALAGATVAIPVEAPAPPRAGRGELILVVDDEPPVREATRAVLEANGYRVVCAADGREALAMFDQQGAAIGAVLLDMMMPGMSGLEVLRALRQRRPDVGIVAASGLGVAERVGEAMAAGARAFLHKPFTTVQLLSAIGEALPD